MAHAAKNEYLKIWNGIYTNTRMMLYICTFQQNGNANDYFTLSTMWVNYYKQENNNLSPNKQ